MIISMLSGNVWFFENFRYGTQARLSGFRMKSPHSLVAILIDSGTVRRAGNGQGFVQVGQASLLDIDNAGKRQGPKITLV